MDNAEPSDLSVTPHRERDVVANLSDPYARQALRTAYHLRRYAAIYVVGGLAALTVGLLPTIPAGTATVATNADQGSGGVYGTSGGAGSSGTAGAAGPGTGNVVGGTGSTSGGGGGGAGSGATSGAAGLAGTPGAGSGVSVGGGSVGPVHLGSGVTRAGVPCKPGVRQLPYSIYAAPCIGKFTGNNGGATWNGVTSKTITFGIRTTSDASGANAASSEATAKAAGGVSPTVLEGYARKMIAYFNSTFELYGRTVKLVDYDGQGNGASENLDGDQAAACADADKAATTVHAFAALQKSGLFEYPSFARCAPRYKVMVPFGLNYFPESDFQKYAPYVWSTVTSCSVGGLELAEYLGKQLAPNPAKYAGLNGSVNMAGKQRKFAIFVPSNAGYQSCMDDTKRVLKEKYGVSGARVDQYNYALDVSQFGTDANRAAIQFAADGDTTVVLNCDPVVPALLTQAAKKQNYFPEWVITGVALTDADNWAQLWDQAEVTGRLLGMSQNGSIATQVDPKGEIAKAVKAAGLPLDANTAYVYLNLLPIFNQLQFAGPVLTPANYAAGTRSLPELGGPTGAEGTWHYGNSHTAIVDSREVWWDATRTSPVNGNPGAYVEMYGGRRFRVGQFPNGEPPAFR